MKLAHVVLGHSADPQPLFDSIPAHPESVWYAFLHSKNDQIEQTITQSIKERDGIVFTYRENRGLAKSWNDAIHLALEAKCDGVMLLNDDLTFYPGGYEKLRRVAADVMAITSTVGIVTCLGLETGAEYLKGSTIPQSFACCILTGFALKKVGYFDENFWPAYFEDIDYAHRCVLSGLATHVIEDEALVEHRRSATLRHISEQEKAALMEQRAVNERYFNRKWGGDGKHLTPFGDAKKHLHIAYPDRLDPFPDERR